MLFVPFSFDLDEQCGDGLWSRAQLEEMNRFFVAAMEQAFANGGESRASAAATVRVGSRRLAEEKVIEAAWSWFQNIKFQAGIAEVLSRCPGVAPERVRVGFRKRLLAAAGFG
jgi:hypothetical protein